MSGQWEAEMRDERDRREKIEIPTIVATREDERQAMVESAQFVHDCERCVFIGRIAAIPYTGICAGDLYFCSQGGNPTMIVRHGNDGWEYSSGECLARDLPVPLLNVWRAFRRKYRNPSDGRRYMRSERRHRSRQLRSWLKRHPGQNELDYVFSQMSELPS